MNDANSTEHNTDPIRDRFESNNQTTVFKNKNLLDPKTIIDPDRIVGRDQQLDQTISYLQAVLNGNRSPDLLLYGPTGTGNSLIINSVCDTAAELAQAETIDFTTLELSCQKIGSYDRAIYALVKQAAVQAGEEIGVPRKGVSTDVKLDRLYELISTHYDSVMVILDEVDLLTGSRKSESPAFSDLIYQLSRTTQLGVENCDVSIAALTNDPSFMQDLDSRAFSSYNPEKIAFPDYDANELRSILNHRKDAFKNGILSEAVIKLSAALGAQDHGDARQAIGLLRKAGEIANYGDEQEVNEDHVRRAQKETEKEATLSQMQGMSKHKRLALYSVAATKAYSRDSVDMIPNSVAYDVYGDITSLLETKCKSKDMFLRYIKEAETYGFVQSQTKGHGPLRGVHKYYSIVNDPSVVINTLQEDTQLAKLKDNTPKINSVVNTHLKNFN